MLCRLLGQTKCPKERASRQDKNRFRSSREGSKKPKYTLDDLLHEHEAEEQARLKQKENEKILELLEKEIEAVEKKSHSFNEELFEGQKELERVGFSLSHKITLS